MYTYNIILNKNISYVKETDSAYDVNAQWKKTFFLFPTEPVGKNLLKK